jgi:uncharacterized LabA/DUF88 family protein
MKNKADFIPPKNKNDLTGVLASLIRKKRISVFIDSANLYYAASTANLKIDYFQIARWFQDNCKLAGLNFYTAYDPADSKQHDFFSDLEQAGYRVIKKPIKIFEGSTKGNMDIELAVDALLQSSLYDTLILVSGDSDFRYLVQALEGLGKQTIILGIGGFTSYELHQEADNYFFLNRIAEVWQKPTRKRGAKKDEIKVVKLPSKMSENEAGAEPFAHIASLVEAKTKPKELKVKVKLKKVAKTTNDNQPNNSASKTKSSSNGSDNLKTYQKSIRSQSKQTTDVPQIFAD